MDNSIGGLAILTFDADRKLMNILYPDGSEMFGTALEEYCQFMEERFAIRWATEKNTLRLVGFDATHRPPARNVYEEGERQLDPRVGDVVWSFSSKGEVIGVRYDDGAELFGEAISEWNAMVKEKYGHLWEANKGKLRARRGAPNSELRGLVPEWDENL